MSPLKSLAALGALMQLAYVPADLDAALKFWTGTIGAGPFFAIDHVRLEATRYRGNPVEIDFSILLGYWGEIQIELVTQHNDAPSIFTAWRVEGREGLHHVCLLVEDMGNARQICQRAGLLVAQEAIVPGGGEVIYIETQGGPAAFVELLKPVPGTREFFRMMRDAHRNWDGSAPVRRLG